MHNNRNNRDYSSDYNRTNKIYNHCIPTTMTTKLSQKAQTSTDSKPFNIAIEQ